VQDCSDYCIFDCLVDSNLPDSLHFAAKDPDPEVLKIFLEHHFEKLDALNNYNHPPIYQAIRSRRHENVRVLIAAGALLTSEEFWPLSAIALTNNLIRSSPQDDLELEQIKQILMKPITEKL
jgi:ankyrin repeat protein